MIEPKLNMTGTAAGGIALGERRAYFDGWQNNGSCDYTAEGQYGASRRLLSECCGDAVRPQDAGLRP